MKKVIQLILVFAGATLGYYLSLRNQITGIDLFLEIIYGGVVGSVLSTALLDKQYGFLFGAIIGIVIFFSIDLIAGSPIVFRGKLLGIFVCSFIGWGFSYFWRSVLIGASILGIVGLILGFKYSHYFGEICLPPGMLNTSLFAIRLMIFGGLIASLYMKAFGYRYMKANSV